MNTRPETFMPLIHCIIDDTLSQTMPQLRQTLLLFINVMNLMSVENVCGHASMPKEDILAFNVTQEYTNNYIYLVNFVNNKENGCVRYVRIFATFDIMFCTM